MSGGAFISDYVPSDQDVQLYDKLEVNAVNEETGKVIVYDLVKDKLQDSVTVGFIPGTKQIETTNLITYMEQRIIEVQHNYLT